MALWLPALMKKTTIPICQKTEFVNQMNLFICSIIIYSRQILPKMNLSKLRLGSCVTLNRLLIVRTFVRVGDTVPVTFIKGIFSFLFLFPAFIAHIH